MKTKPPPQTASAKPLSRREFIGQSALAATFAPAVAGAFTGTAPSVRAAGIGPNNRIRVALIGSGGMGRGDLATFFKYDDVDCPVLCDVDDAMLAKGVELVEKQRGKKPDAVKDFRRVLERKDATVRRTAKD